MDKETLTKELERTGYPGVTNLTIKECPVDTNAHGKPFYPRERQLYIMRGRLRGAERHDKSHKMIPYLKEWIAAFESLPEDAPIYFWQGEYNGKRLDGRCTTDRIIQIFPQDVI